MCGGGGPGGGSGDSGEPDFGLAEGADVSTGNIAGQGNLGSVPGSSGNRGDYGHISDMEALSNSVDTGELEASDVANMPGMYGSSPQVSFSRRGMDMSTLLAGTFFGGAAGFLGGLIGGVGESAIQGSGVEGGMDMSGDPTGGNATGGPDIPTPTGPRGVFKPVVEATPEDTTESELVDLGKTPQEIDAMNKLAEKRNLRFAPERGEESLMRSMDILSERDRLVGARGPDMFKRTPRSTLKRREGSGLTYDEYL